MGRMVLAGSLTYQKGPFFKFQQKLFGVPGVATNFIVLHIIFAHCTWVANIYIYHYPHGPQFQTLYICPQLIYLKYIDLNLNLI